DRYKSDSKTPKSQVWAVSTSGGDAHALTAGPRSDHTPRWSPDGRWLAFLSDRLEDGQLQVYVLPRHGGEALPLTQVSGDIQDLKWSADSQHVYFLKTDGLTAEEKQRDAAKDDAIEFEEHPKFARVYVVGVKDKQARPLTHPSEPERAQFHAWEFDASPDGKQLAFAAGSNPFEWSWYQSWLAVSLVADGGGKTETRTLHQSKRSLARPLFSPDGKWVAFLTGTWSDRGVTSGDLYVAPASGDGPARNLVPDYGGSISWMEWSPDSSSLLFLALENVRSTFAEVNVATGHITKLWSGEVAIANPNQQVFSVTTGRQALAVVRESATEPRDVWLATRRGDALEWSKLTNLFPQIGEFALPQMESIEWQGADGWPIQGFLVMPVGYQHGRRYPLVTLVHGGPTSAYTYAFSLTNRWVALLAARGIAVLMPNPRGSIGWGMNFAEANLGDMGGKDFQDIMAGVDACVASGIADEHRLGISGWSYGGFMTMWAVSQTGRFKVAMAGAGISNWKSFHGLTKYPTWDALFYGADPYDGDKEAAYELFSPLTYIKRIKTPTLIIHGERDPDVPVGQSYEFHRALKDHGVETQLVIYPRERHGFVEQMHLLDLWRRIAQWFAVRL
ncbi:MAG: S9 family peptidase, partial [Chloroflexi bacterium]|nr:S9 family peptidase [Chloroflexota bacterium]